jgi:hypothetical protein
MPASGLLVCLYGGAEKGGGSGGYAAGPGALARAFGVFGRMKRGPGKPGPLSAS